MEVRVAERKTMRCHGPGACRDVPHQYNWSRPQNEKEASKLGVDILPKEVTSKSYIHKLRASRQAFSGPWIIPMDPIFRSGHQTAWEGISPWFQSGHLRATWGVYPSSECRQKTGGCVDLSRY
ncbi:hypothetical protein PAXRUDRAFT_826598 [Paxillus rubicundulus Ve08.2h10]|uniref:Uncharacterized protein n=1 Tax=Paxillus rubicundulus Ve08.2h10 TaxID=930991 RepID=A0A0D0DEC9_9AGAM|nr:hypothetical protein PAXRUDRAFT_826598 [Paxillus rubicundulus Ve08.2h10]